MFGRLKHNETGPGYIHFHNEAGQEYFKQLTAERQVVRYVKGFASGEKKPRTETGVNVLVYAYAALNFLYMGTTETLSLTIQQNNIKDDVLKRKIGRIRT